MSRLRISGVVLGIDTKPITNASITITDKDVGSSNDRILRTETNHLGQFSGLSREWSDSNWIDGPWNTRVPTPDLMLLEFTVKKGDESHTGPFIHLADNLSAPIICPWNDPRALFAKIDGEEFYDAFSTAEKIKDLTKSGSDFELEIFNETVKDAFSPLAGGNNVTDQFVGGRIQGFAAVEIIVATTGLLIAIAMIISVAGASIATVYMGIALLEAVSSQNCSPEVEQDAGIDQNGRTRNILKMKFNC